jgi:hypothetical protein
MIQMLVEGGVGRARSTDHLHPGAVGMYLVCGIGLYEDHRSGDRGLTGPVGGVEGYGVTFDDVVDGFHRVPLELGMGPWSEVDHVYRTHLSPDPRPHHGPSVPIALNEGQRRTLVRLDYLHLIGHRQLRFLCGLL